MHKTIVRKDRFDKEYFQQYNEEIRQVNESEDLFAATFRKCWKFRKSARQINPSLRNFLRQAAGVEEFEQLREQTVGRAENAISVVPGLLDQFNEYCRKSPKNAEDLAVFREKLRKLIKEEEERLEAQEEMMSLLGYSKVSNEKMAPEEVKNLSRKIKDSKFKKFMKFAGRMRSSASQKLMTRTDHGNQKLVGVEFGNDLSNILSIEKIFSDVAPDFFALKFAEKRLQQLRHEGEMSEEQGPFIVLLDQSDSMDIWNEMANGILFGLWEIAQVERRKICVVQFTHQTRVTEIKKARDVLGVYENPLSGSTDFDLALLKAKDWMDKNPSKSEKMDFVVVSDGQFDVSEENKKFLAAKRQKLITLQVGRYPFKDVKEISSDILDVTELNFEQMGETLLSKLLGG